MNRTNKKRSFIIIGFIFTFILSCLPVSEVKTAGKKHGTMITTQVKTSYGYKPIWIQSISDFATFNIPGDGSYSNPYRIENRAIDAANTTTFKNERAIRIDWQSVHVMIRNCTLYDATKYSYDAGILLSQCGNITITNCTVWGNNIGISIGSCKNITIEDTIVTGSSGDGISIDTISNTINVTNSHVLLNQGSGISCTGIDCNMFRNEVKNNNIFGILIENNCSACDNDVISNSADGITVSRYYNTIRNNSVFGNSYAGISLTNWVGHNDVIDNHVSNNDGVGIDLSVAGYNNVSNNVIVNNVLDGIKVSGTSAERFYNIIVGNTITGNGGNGLVIKSCWYNLVTKNSIAHNAKIGIHIESAASNQVFLNYITFNTLSQGYINGSSTGNSWDNGVDGNYWSDYKTRYPNATNDGIHWKTPYVVNGTVSNADRYPLYGSPTEYPFIAFRANKTTISVGDWVQFTFTGKSGALPANFSWNFSDGTVNSTTRDPKHQYLLSGSYDVSLTINDSLNQTDSFKFARYITVVVDVPLAANFSVNATSISAKESIQFTFTGKLGNEPTLTIWNFGDSSDNSSNTNPIHKFLQDGEFTVRLTIIDIDGDSSTCQMVVHVSTPSPAIDGYEIGLLAIAILAISFVLARRRARIGIVA